jgi:cell division GTPase FtsZ
MSISDQRQLEIFTILILERTVEDYMKRADTQEVFSPAPSVETVLGKRKAHSPAVVGQVNLKKASHSSAAVEHEFHHKRHTPTSGAVTLGFAFAGGCGTNNARRFMASIAPEDFPYLYILVANTDGPQLKEFFDISAVNHDLNDTEKANLGKWVATIEGNRQLTILELGESGSGAGGDPEVGRIAAEDKKEEFEQWMKPLRAIIIAGGAGKGTGSGALPVIQKIANGLDKSPLTIVTMPFAFEGGGRMRKAQATLKILYEQGPTMPIYNENVPKSLSMGKGFGEIFNEINNASIQPVFFGIREVTQIVGDMQNVDIADWRKVLSVGNYVTCDYSKLIYVNEAGEAGESAGEEDLEVFIQRLLCQDTYQDHRARRNATGVLAWAHGKWNPDEVKSIIGVATEELNPGIADDLEIFPGIHMGTDGAKWMMILSVASKGPESSFMNIGNGDAVHNGKAVTIYLPIEGQNTPVEVMVDPEVANRWKMLYYKRKEELSPSERHEFGILMGAMSSRAGKAVFNPKA